MATRKSKSKSAKTSRNSSRAAKPSAKSGAPARSKAAASSNDKGSKAASPKATTSSFSKQSTVLKMLYEPKGCSNCNNTGYKGRMGVHELLTGTDEVKRAVQRRAPIDELRELAMQQGMRTLLQDALEKAMRGVTDVKQARSIAVK